MSLLIKNIYLQENEKNIFHSLQNQGINTLNFEKHFLDLFNKSYNNEVGYYIFKQDGIVYKIIILPKTIDIKSKNIQKDFINYLLHYHRVNNKYKFDETKQIPNSLLSLAFKNNNDEANSHEPIEQFEFYKYKAILESIERFFKRHKNYKKINIGYKSQGIKYKLNLSKNIKELDKTKIHQTQTVDMMFSQISTIAYNTLKLFSVKKINTIKADNLRQELIKSTKKIINFISKKYSIDRSYKLTLAKLNSFKTIKVFSKKNDTQSLLVDIKSLFGFEQMYNDNNVSVNNRYDLTTTSFFINPSTFYEWYVYEILEDYANKNCFILLFDKSKDESKKTTSKYNFISIKNKKYKQRNSNPDYIIVDERKKVKLVLDAKWKNIKVIKDIKSSDFLKLKHDSILLECENYKSIPYMIYPNYLTISDRIEILKQKDKDKYFNFGVLQIDMNFEKDKNNINFKYDFEKIEKQVRIKTIEENIQNKSEVLTDEISDKRTELITELLNNESLENKEEVFNKLDMKLLKVSYELSTEVQEKLSDEVIEILDKYENILAKDSIKFLKSSSSVYNYYKDKGYEHFDYSIAGIGLWKLVELELNTSFSWYLRILSQVCNNSCPWTNISNPRKSITQDLHNGKKVKLNQYEHGDKNRLQGIMLGGISLLLQDEETIKEFADISELNTVFFQNDLNGFVKKIIDLRNEHSHIKAMPLEKFNELFTLLFGKERNIFKLMEMKKIIKLSIDSIT